MVVTDVEGQVVGELPPLLGDRSGHQHKKISVSVKAKGQGSRLCPLAHYEALGQSLQSLFSLSGFPELPEVVVLLFFSDISKSVLPSSLHSRTESRMQNDN